LKFFIAHLVSRFKLAVVIRLLLNGVIGEMDHPVRQVLDAVFIASGAQITFFIGVSL
jgi:hypothetical protein